MARLRSLFLDMWRAHRPLAVFAVGNIGLAVFSLFAMAIDPRVLGGMPIWTKPFKFAVSFFLYTVMWMWLISRARGWTPTNRWMGTIIAVAGVGELVVIVLQVVRGRQSHFNITTVFDGLMWSFMAVMIIVLFVANLIWSIALWRNRDGDRSVTLAIRFGIVISIIGLALGGTMVSPRPDQLEAEEQGLPTMSGAHAVGVPDGGPGIPVFGWSTEGGDLRIGHFVGMHGLQLIPIFALALALLAARIPALRDEIARVRMVIIIGLAYAAVVALVVWQALRGQSIIAPDALTLGVLGAIITATLVASAWALSRSPDHLSPDSSSADSSSPDNKAVPTA